MAYSKLTGSDITIRIQKDGTKKSYLSKENKRVSNNNQSIKNLLKVKAIGDGVQILKNAAEYYYIDRNLSLEDNYQGQRDWAIAKSLTSNAISIGKATLIGATSLGLAGGFVAGTVAAIGIGINAGINLDRQNIKLMQMDSQLSYSREKAGYSLTMEDKGTNL